MNNRIKKQQVVYNKTSGEIKLVVSIDKRPFSIKELNLFKVNEDDLDILIAEDNVFIDIRRDRVDQGVLCSGKLREPINVEDLFEDVIDENRKLSKIGLITTWRKQCGIAKYSEDLANELLNDVTIFCEKDSDSSDSKLIVIPSWGKDDKTYLPLVKELQKNKIDIVHVQYNHGLMNAGEVKKLGDELRCAGIKSYITLHSTKGGVSVFAEHFDNVVVHSNVCVQDLLDEGVDKKKILQTRIGSFIADNYKTKEEARIIKGLDQSRKIISNFGFFLSQKGIREQIYALELMKEKYPDILLLVICAIHTFQNEEKSLKYYEECKDLVVELKLEDNVLFVTDFLPFNEIYDYLYCSDLISLPYIDSAAQGTSSAGRTAMSVLRPVIATNVDIFADLDGVIPKVEARDFEALAQETINILEDENYQNRIIKTIKEFIEETSWENIAKEHSKFYKAFGDINLHIEGQVFSYFSASIVNRRLACGLDDLGVNVSLSSVNMAENKLIELGDNSKQLINRQRTYDICMRHHYPPKFSDINADVKIMYLPVETTSVPDNKKSLDEAENWLENIDKHVDYVWTYTNHGRNVLLSHGVKKPIEVIKCGYDNKLFNTDVIAMDLSKIKDSYTKKTLEIEPETFVFMFCGHAQQRKNFDVILDAYLMEFTREEDTVFVIKSYDGGEVHKIILNKLSDAADAKNIPVTELPKILYIYEDTAPDILPRYYKAANCMVQCSRAEGFGLPIIEAMALGVPSIVTPWSGPLDFVSKDNSFYVEYELIESNYHVQSKDKKSYWAEVKMEDLQKVMRYVVDNPKEVEEKGNQGIIDMKKWTMEEAAFDIIKFLRKIK